jgi:hypothetical protein
MVRGTVHDLARALGGVAGMPVSSAPRTTCTLRDGILSGGGRAAPAVSRR